MVIYCINSTKIKLLCHSVKSFCFRATASKSRRIMSAVGTPLLQSPGRNEGETQYETLGTHKTKVNISPARAILLHSPGQNEGEAQYETLGIHKTKGNSKPCKGGTFPTNTKPRTATIQTKCAR